MMDNGVKDDVIEVVRETLNIVGDVMGAYFPLIQMATVSIEKITETCKTADYNKNICNTLADRVELAKAAIDSLQRRKQKHEAKLRDEAYYRAFHKFIYVLKEIDTYTLEISKIGGFRKYTKANLIKEKFNKLIDDYDRSMKDLQFTMAIVNEEQREIDKEALNEDLAEFSKHLEKLEGVVNNIYEEIIFIKNRDNDKALHGPNKIDSKDLEPPNIGKPGDVRSGKKQNVVMKKILKGQEVCCKLVEEEMNKIHLEILMKLSQCNHILRFYGISKISDNNVMVFEWAERGTLKELYERKDIQWHCKVRIALNICRGLIFLQRAEILHHDLKCENILMTQSLDPKIYNFELARYDSGKTTSLGEMNDIVRWSAPEKLSNPNYRYSTQCEIYSFGMLLWELAFEKVPYRSWKVGKIKDHVIKGGREIIKFGKLIPEISNLKNIQEDYKKIIEGSWKQTPHERISFLKILDMLEELHNSISHLYDDNLPDLLPDKALDLDGSKAMDDDLDIPDDDIVPVIQLDEGIHAYRAGEHQKAWKCFEYHAENDNVTAKYWKGRYLWEGLHDGIKEREEGRKLLKEAADKENPDAQLRYAFTLLRSLGEGNNREIFMTYITKAANEGNSAAQFHLGEIYYKGKCKTPEDKEVGIKWLRKSALQNNNKALSFLEKSGIDIYDV